MRAFSMATATLPASASRNDSWASVKAPPERGLSTCSTPIRPSRVVSGAQMSARVLTPLSRSTPA